MSGQEKCNRRVCFEIAGFRPGCSLDFQSPLHWGSLWNLVSYITDEALLFLSVPSSLGKSLELHYLMSDSHCWNSFSPLFIGEVSGTTSNDSVRHAENFFQSPLHWGSLWNLKRILPYLNYTKPFSPLFIGEVSGTVRPPVPEIVMD